MKLINDENFIEDLGKENNNTFYLIYQFLKKW
jgi:hypothetical protein